MSTLRQSIMQGSTGAEAAADLGEDLVAAERGGVGLDRRQHLLQRDRGRHVPGRVDDDVLDLVGEDRRLIGRLADDDAGGVDDLAVLVDVEGEIRNVDPDVEAAEIARHPAPALHVGEDRGDVVDRRRR